MPGRTGDDLAEALKRFLDAEDDESASDLWFGLEGAAFAQNTLYAGAVPTVSAMLAALAEQPPAFLREWIIEVVRFILCGGSGVDPSLHKRCLDGAREGIWLLAAEAEGTAEPVYADAVLEVLSLIDPALADITRTGLE